MLDPSGRPDKSMMSVERHEAGPRMSRSSSIGLVHTARVVADDPLASVADQMHQVLAHDRWEVSSVGREERNAVP